MAFCLLPSLECSLESAYTKDGTREVTRGEVYAPIFLQKQALPINPSTLSLGFNVALSPSQPFYLDSCFWRRALSPIQESSSDGIHKDVFSLLPLPALMMQWAEVKDYQQRPRRALESLSTDGDSSRGPTPPPQFLLS